MALVFLLSICILSKRWWRRTLYPDPHCSASIVFLECMQCELVDWYTFSLVSWVTQFYYGCRTFTWLTHLLRCGSHYRIDLTSSSVWRMCLIYHVAEQMSLFQIMLNPKYRAKTFCRWSLLFSAISINNDGQGNCFGTFLAPRNANHPTIETFRKFSARKARRRSSKQVDLRGPTGRKASKRSKWAYQTWRCLRKLPTRLSMRTWWRDGRMAKSMQVPRAVLILPVCGLLTYHIDIYWTRAH